MNSTKLLYTSLKSLGSVARGAALAVPAMLALTSTAFADSITPGTFSATLGVGESVTIDKIVTVTPSGGGLVDVFFLADTTGSMGGVINAVKASASTILSSTASLGDVAFGVGEYKDFGDAYAYRLNTAMTSNQATAQAGINAWGASGGGDLEEANLYGLSRMASDPGTGWRTGSARIAVWFGDAPGHDPSGGVTEAIATANLVDKNIEVEALNTGNLNGTGQAQRIATATGGTYYPAINTGNIVDTITDAITSAVVNYTNVSLDTSDVPAGVGVAFTPGSYVGTYDRSVERTFGFSVTFTGGTTPGTYDFPIYATVDGGRVATETDSITVGTPVPEPGSLTLLGLGLAAFGLNRQRRRLAA